MIVPTASAAETNASTANQYQSEVSASVISRQLVSLTSQDLKDIAGNARAHGDLEGAAVLDSYANQLNNAGLRTGRIQSINIITTIAKKAIIKIFRWGATKLPAKLRPYAWKIADFLETLQNWEEGPIIWGLMQLGIPYDVAQQAAWWIVTFLG
jgi:hypothetical protein